MKIRPFAVVCCILSLTALGRAAESPFFAMNTIAKGGPDVVVPLLKELGYAGLGGAAGDRPMAEALKQAGLKFFNGYLTLALHPDRPALDDKLRAQLDAMKGFDTVLWLAVSKLQREGAPPMSRSGANDNIVAARLKEIADYAKARGVKVALYPHTGQYLAHFEDAIQMAERLNHPAVGVTFNLCHWLKVEGSERDPAPLLKAALPRLMFVTINGADTGDTKAMNWTRLILPLGEGSYDVGAFLRKVRAAGYTGPIGFQGYGIKAPPREVLAKTMEAWKRMQASAQ
ncbi:MAG: sugar phosphate isomerase/epimerase family protein [Opitutaceae bacterium]|nr:sugar phosphate isomerase/epimerase family protein [Opitutaceae bacterium]